jgi:hypothetical protein
MNRRVRLRIRYDRRSGLVALVALAVLVAALLGYLAWAQREAAASGPQVSFGFAQDRQDRPFGYPFDLAQGRAQDRPFGYAQDRPLATSAGLRGYYLTQGTYNGADADGADGNGAGVCAEGYHFASLWEILDPSNLKYNTDLGLVRDDSGQGPPTLPPTLPLVSGWVRTGFGRSGSTTPGVGNCDGWDSSSDSDWGTLARLPSDWTAGQDIHVWQVDTTTCNTDVSVRVWCVADDVAVSAPAYLPLILKNRS